MGTQRKLKKMSRNGKFRHGFLYIEKIYEKYFVYLLTMYMIDVNIDV